MKSQISALATVVSLVVAVPLWLRANDDTAVQADDEAAISAIIEQTEAANNAGDVEGWVSLFADDAVYMTHGMPAVTTRDELKAVAEAGFRHDANVDIEPIEIKVCEDWAFARSKVTGTVTLHNTREVVPIDMKQITIYQRNSDGTWRIARLISNSNRS